MYKFLILVILMASCKQKDKSECFSDLDAATIITNGSTYDSLYAEKLEADKYGMHQYVMAFLKAGPNRDQSEEEATELQKGHMNNIGRLAEEGALVLAGPFLDDGDLKGIYIFKVGSIEEAEKLTKTDPAIKAGRLVMELHPWYGSAAIMEVNEIHKRISKIKV